MAATNRDLNINNQEYVRPQRIVKPRCRVQKLLMIRGFPVDVSTANFFFADRSSKPAQMRPVRQPSRRASLASRG
jgi:hypothetical protein